MGQHLPRGSADNGSILTGHLPSLDGWRAISIGLVIFAHGTTSIEMVLAKFGALVDLQPLRFLGLLGVQIFFAISGFLITTKLIEERHISGRVSVAEFYVRRAFRILPAAIFFISFVQFLKMIAQIEVTTGRVISTIFFVSNYSAAETSWYLGRFWSLAVEEHFYIIWPLVFVLIASDKRKIVALFSAAAVCAFWRAVDFKYNLTGHTSAAFWGRTDIQADNIIFGVAAAMVVSKVGTERIRALATPRVFWSLILLVGISYLAAHIGWKTAFLMLTARAILIAAIIAISVVNFTGLRLGLLASPAMIFVGSISYSLYLWQQIFLVQDSNAPGWWGSLQSFPLNVALAFGAAIASRSIIEKPFMKRGRAAVAMLRNHKVLITNEK